MQDIPLSAVKDVGDPAHIDVAENKDEDRNIDKDLQGTNLVKSTWDDLTIPQLLWTFKKTMLVTLLVYTGYLCEGFELLASGTVVANAGFIKQFGDDSSGGGVRALSSTWVSTWSALLNVGQLLTFTHIFWIAERWGRKASFYVAWVWLVVGCIFLNTAKTPSVWALAKVCNGAGIGVLQITCQIYVAEIVPNRIRGGMVTFQAAWSNVGGIIVSLMMQQLNQKHPDNYLLAMRILWAPIGLMLPCWIFVPESPWFYARRDNREAAMKSLHRLYGGIKDYNHEEEYNIICRTIALEKEALKHQPGWKDVFKGMNRKRALPIIYLTWAQQFLGQTIISNFSTYFFSLAGVKDPFLATLILACVNLAATLFWSFSADKVGRRILITSFETFVCFVLFVVGGLYYAGASTGNVPAGTALLVICCAWTFCFQIIANSYYLYSAELPAALVRAVRSGCVTYTSNSVTALIFCYATPPMLLRMNIKAAFVFGALSIPVCILLWLYLPETKGRSTGELDELYERKIPAWRFKNTVTEAEEQMHATVRARQALRVQA